MSYLILEGRKISKVTSTIIKKLKEESIKHTHIICTGNSGVILASVVAARSKKTLIILRKGESNHGNQLEYKELSKTRKRKCVFIDDMIDTGATLEKIVTALKDNEFLCRRIRLVASLFYNQADDEVSEGKKERINGILQDVPTFWINPL